MTNEPEPPLHPCLISLSSEELAKLPELTEDQVREALEKGYQEKQAYLAAYYSSAIRFR